MQTTKHPPRHQEGQVTLSEGSRGLEIAVLTFDGRVHRSWT